MRTAISCRKIQRKAAVFYQTLSNSRYLNGFVEMSLNCYISAKIMYAKSVEKINFKYEIIFVRIIERII